MKEKVYLVGPMTGYPHYNYFLFMAVAALWRDAGYDVKTPFELNSVVWQRHYGRDFDPFNDTCDYGDPILAEMCAEDIKWLSESDIIAVLPGWHLSKGTTTEVLVGQNLQKDICDALTAGPLGVRVAALVTT